MSVGDWLPPWFRDWLSEVYHPTHGNLGRELKELRERITTIEESGTASAQTLQRIELRQLAENTNRGRLSSWLKTWIPPCTMVAIFLADKLHLFAR